MRCHTNPLLNILFLSSLALHSSAAFAALCPPTPNNPSSALFVLIRTPEGFHKSLDLAFLIWRTLQNKQPWRGSCPGVTAITIAGSGSDLWPCLGVPEPSREVLVAPGDTSPALCDCAMGTASQGDGIRKVGTDPQNQHWQPLAESHHTP